MPHAASSQSGVNKSAKVIDVLQCADFSFLFQFALELNELSLLLLLLLLLSLLQLLLPLLQLLLPLLLLL